MALQLYLHNQKLSERKFVSYNGGDICKKNRNNKN